MLHVKGMPVQQQTFCQRSWRAGVATAVAAWGLLALVPLAQAQKIQTVRLMQPQVRLGDEIQLLVSLQPTGSMIRCGLEVDFGNGDTRTLRVGENGESDLQQVVRYAYFNPGKYTLSLKGVLLVRGLKSALACEGKPFQQEVLVVDPAVEARERELAERERALAERERALAERERTSGKR